MSQNEMKSHDMMLYEWHDIALHVLTRKIRTWHSFGVTRNDMTWHLTLGTVSQSSSSLELTWGRLTWADRLIDRFPARGRVYSQWRHSWFGWRWRRWRKELVWGRCILEDIISCSRGYLLVISWTLVETTARVKWWCSGWRALRM